MKLFVMFSLIVFIESLNDFNFRPFDWLCMKPFLCDDKKNYHLNQIIKGIEGSFDMKQNVIFLLNSKGIKDYPIVINDRQSLIDSGFNVNLPTRVIIHGFLNNATSRINRILSKAYLRRHNVNVIKGRYLSSEKYLKINYLLSNNSSQFNNCGIIEVHDVT